MAIAYFDLDKTLLSFNSASRWVRSELRLGHLGARNALVAFGWIARYQLGFAGIESAMLRSIATLRGSREKDLRDRTLSFFEREIRDNFRPGGLAAIETHRRAGDSVVLLTGSSTYLSEAVARDLELDGYLCNRFEVDTDGCFTGRPIEPLCFGHGKVVYAEKHAAKQGRTLSECSYYGDSKSDLPMLEAVGHPVVINPDWRLAHIARTRHWAVEDWGTPERAAQPKR